MKYLVLGILGLFSIHSAYSNPSINCEAGWNKIINDYKQEFDKVYKEAEMAWGNANYEQSQRGNKLPGQESALPLDQWKLSIRNQGFEIDRAARKLEEARRVYDYYDRIRPTTGWQSYVWWKNPRQTWYAVDVEDLMSERACIGKFVDYNGVSMSIRLAAQNFDREVRKKTAQMIARVTQLRELAKWLEESEIKRLNPEKYNHCMLVAGQYADPILAREFCGEIDSVGYQKLAPFMGCMTNLNFWGYRDANTTRSSFRARGDLKSSKFFDTCRESENIQQMLAGTTWSNCMKRVVTRYSYPADAGRFCANEQNTATPSSNADHSGTATAR
jgi:hypothetical protein